MAIKFHAPDGSETDMVINSLKFFPVSSGEDFRDMLLAVAESPPGAPKPTKLEQFAASHPNMPRALATVQTPDSFADEEYYGVDAFFLVNGSALYNRAGKTGPSRSGRGSQEGTRVSDR